MKGKLPFYFCSRWGLVQFSSVAQPCLTLCDLMDCSIPGVPVHHQLPELAQTHVHRVGDAIQPFYPLSSPSPDFSLSQHQGLFQSVLHIRWPKYWNFSFSISPSSEYSGLISFRINWFDLLAVQGILKISNTTVQKHEFFGAQLSLWSNSHIHTGSYSPFFSSVYLTRVCGMCYLKRISLGSSVSLRVFCASLNTSVCNVSGRLKGNKCEQNILLTEQQCSGENKDYMQFSSQWGSYSHWVINIIPGNQLWVKWCS